MPNKDSFIAEYNGKTYIYIGVSVKDYAELTHLVHEIAHALCGISDETTPEWLDEVYEKRVWAWVFEYLVPYDNIVRTLKQPVHTLRI